MTISTVELWALIISLGIGTLLIRLSFLGLIGRRKLPEWLLRHLRYTPVAILPGLVAPLVLWPQSTGGVPDVARSAAACATILAGIVTKSAFLAILAGAFVLGVGLAFF